MPSALETLIKILKLERSQGGRDSAVQGGLGAYAANWQQEAREQARRPQHQILIDEIVDTLREYAKIDARNERIDTINYLLDRVVDRRKAPQKYQERLSEWQAKMRTQRDSPSRGSQTRPRRQHVDWQPSRQSGGGGRGRYRGADSATFDEDFTSGRGQRSPDIPPLPSLDRPPRQKRKDESLEQQLAVLEAMNAPTSEVKGIGRKYAELLEQLNLSTIRDLLYNMPRDYVDYTRLVPICDLKQGETANVIATVRSVRRVVARGGQEDLLVDVSDATATLAIRFFSQPYLSAKLRPGMMLLLRGRVGYFRDQARMASPEWEELDMENLRKVGIVPVYGMTKGLRPRLFRRTMKTLTGEWQARIPDPLPLSLLERNDLADLGWALRQAHFPAGEDHKHHAKRRLAFDNLLMLQLALMGKRRAWQAEAGPELRIDQAAIDQFIQTAFPFELTQSQQRAIDDIVRDFQGEPPMIRLLQGEVGSGKTAVAMVALYIAYANGKQAALMAPTSVLAEQNFRAVSEVFARIGGEEQAEIVFLSSALSASQREAAYARIADGSADIVVGTQALIQAGLEFEDLAVTVIDEQQRFGVEQRSHLRGKGGNPHLLVMSATPFPRSLALTSFADMDLSIIDEKPANRKAVKTWIIDRAARERLNGFVVKELEQGRQAFFVHPLVRQSESLDTASAVEAYERLSHVFYRFRVRLLHGQMSASDKDGIMADFAAGEFDVLVTTAVAEVGVDAPNASVIVIDGANRFGLAQLHQFRGRVGRGPQQSYCFLLPDSGEIDIDRIRAAQAGDIAEEELSLAERRLAAVEETDDGFTLADRDWQLRGTGDLLGTRQSGRYEIDLLDPAFEDLIQVAQQEAQTLYADDPNLQEPRHQLLARFLASRYPSVADFS